MILTEKLRGGGLKFAAVLTVLTVFACTAPTISRADATPSMNGVELQAMTPQKDGATQITASASIITDYQGFSYTVRYNKGNGNSIDSLYPIDTAKTETKIHPAIATVRTSLSALYYFVSETGTILAIRSSGVNGGTTINGTETTVPTEDSTRFKANQSIGVGDFHISDESGRLWFLSNGSLTAVKAKGKQILTKANTFRDAGTGTILTDNSSKIWYISKSTATQLTNKTGVTMQPNQFGGDSDQSNEYFYTNNAGNVVDPSGKTTKIGGLTPGLIFPVMRLLIADGSGTLWDTEGAGSTQKITGATFSPGIYSRTNTWGVSMFWGIDKQGILYQGGYNSSTKKWSLTKASDIRFSYPDQLAVSPTYGTDSTGVSVAYAGAQDGTIYLLVGPQTYMDTNVSVRILPTGLHWRAAASADTNSCVVQMPTTGAPVGLSLYGVFAIAVGLAGLSLLLVRRMRV